MSKTLLSAFALLCATFSTHAQSVSAQAETVYQIDFTESQDGWTSVRPNNSGKEWVARTKTQGFYESGQYLDCVGLSSSSTPSTDAWYVSPSISLKAGYTYEVTTLAARKSNITLSLNLGTSNSDMTGYTQIDELSPISTSYDPTSAITKEVTVEKDGVYHFALHASTTENYAPYDCYLFNFEVKGNAPAEPDDDTTPLPYIADLSQTDEGWTNANYNGDGETWMFFEGMGVGMASQMADAADAYISPAFRLKKDRKYKVAANVQMYNTPTENDHLALAISETMGQADLMLLKQFELKQQGYNVDSVEFSPEADGVYYISFVNTTEANVSNGAIILSAFGIRDCTDEAKPGDEIVFADDFTADDRMGQWTTNDANADGTTWAAVDGIEGITYNSDAAGTKAPANDWLFSPAFNTTAGQDYLVTYTMKRQGSFDPDVVEVHFGNNASVEGMTKLLSTDNIDANAEDITRTVRLTATTTGSAHLGFHITSPYSDNGQLSLTSVSVKTAEKSTPAKVENFKATSSHKEKTVTLTWTNPSFDTKGVALNEPLTVKLYENDNEIASVEQQEAGKDGSYTFAPATFEGYATYKAVAVAGSNESEAVSTTINLDDVQGDMVLVKAFDVDYDKASEWKIVGDNQAWKYDYQNVFTYDYRRGSKVADEWLFSPFVGMMNDRRYVVSVELKTSQDYGNNIAITIGDEQDPEAHQQVLAAYYGLQQNGFAVYETPQFTIADNKPYCIGFHVTNSNYYVNVRNLKVSYINDGTIINAVDGVHAAAKQGAVSVFDTTGRLVAKHANTTVEGALQQLPKGLYIVTTTDAEGNTATQKVMK